MHLSPTSKLGCLFFKHVMDTTAIIVMRMVLQYSCLTFQIDYISIQ